MAFGPKHCYVCNSNTVDKKDFAKHMQDHAKDLDKFKFSNSTSDYCRTTCKICGKVSLISNMRIHTKEKHSMVITEYKKKYNQEFYDIVEKCSTDVASANYHFSWIVMWWRLTSMETRPLTT